VFWRSFFWWLPDCYSRSSYFLVVLFLHRNFLHRVVLFLHRVVFQRDRSTLTASNTITAANAFMRKSGQSAGIQQLTRFIGTQFISSAPRLAIRFSVPRNCGTDGDYGPTAIEVVVGRTLRCARRLIGMPFAQVGCVNEIWYSARTLKPA
jgi:hypothetical protein